MANQDSLGTIAATKKVRLMQRRAAVRLPGTRSTFYPPTGERRADLWWEAMLMRLQPAKVSLIVPRRVECGTLVEIDLAGHPASASPTLLARVTEIKHQETGGYLIHGMLVPPLSDEACQALQ